MEISQIDIEGLLTPICAHEPCGQDIMYDEFFLQIKRERQQPDNQNLGVWVVADHKESNWKKVEELCVNLLKNKSKDLMLCAYLLETRIKQNGIFSLSDSLLLILQMTQKYWDHVYPSLEGGEFRKSPFLWLDEKIPLLIKTNPLFIIQNSNYVIQYQDIEDYLIKKEASESVQFLIYHNRIENYEIIIEEIEKCIEYLNELKNFLAEKSFFDGSIFYKIFEIFSFILKFMNLVAKEHQIIESKKKREREEQENIDSWKEDNSGEEIFSPIKKNISHSNSQKNMSFNGMNMTRHEIYQNLRNLAENLAQLEPHSPVPLIIMRSLKWEKKSFLEIVFEVLKISSDKQSIMSLFLDNESENNLEEKVPLNHFNENAANFHNSLEEEDDF